METIVELSREYGRNPRWAIGGGGNTSTKTDDRISVKASGRALGDMSAEDFVELDRRALADILAKPYPSDRSEREVQALADLMEARFPGQGSLRPSVETLMHDVFPQTFVVHTHPTLVNGLTCSHNAETRAYQLFGDELVWIDDVNPGYILGTVVAERVRAYSQTTGRPPWLMLLRNHGLVVAGDTASQIRERNAFVIDTLWNALEQIPAGEQRDGMPAWYAASAKVPAQSPRTHADSPAAQAAAEAVRRVFAELGADSVHVTPHCDENFMELSGNIANMNERLSEAFSPDHLVYARRQPAIVDDRLIGEQSGSEKGARDGTAESKQAPAIRSAVSAYRRRWESLPRVVVIPGVAAFGVDSAAGIANAAGLLCLDALLISRYAENFGGYRFMPPEQIDFIRSWEVERFRQKQARGEA